MSQTKKVFEYGQDINGQGKVIYKWSQDNSFLAVCGESKIVYILDKRGRKLKEISIQTKPRVVQLEWDKDNEYVCILQEELNYVTLWNVFGNQPLVQIEVDNIKSKASFVKWSRTHPVLAIGTDKGSLIFYNKKNTKKIPTVGKHAKRIITGDWNQDGLLVTGSEDKIITVSNYNSDTVHESVSVKLEPRNIKWANPKTDDREAGQKTITAVMSQKSLLMFELGSKKTPLELVFEQKYGKIVDYRLFGDGYIVVGFSEGNVAHISTHMKEMTDEISSERIFQSTLDALTTNDVVYKMAVAGEDQIKIYNLATWKEIKHERIELPKSAGKVNKMSWSNNGQILIVSTMNGYTFGFQTSIPFITSTFQYFSAMLTSFTEITIMDTTRQPQNNTLTTITLENEPSFISLGPYHIAAGINNMIWYYQWLDQKKNGLIIQGELVQKRDYVGSVKLVQINDLWAAVLADNKCILHPIDPKQMSSEVKEVKFPQTENEKAISQIGLTKDFLILLDVAGKLKYYHIQDQQFIIEFQSQQVLTKFYPNIFGTRLICIDNKGYSYYFEASSEFIQQIAQFPQKTDLVLWDNDDPNQFAVLESDQMLTFRINKNNIYGILIEPVKEILSIEQINKSTTPIITILDRGVKPISLSNGFLKCYTQQGLINGQSLGSHSYISQYKEEQDDKEGHFRYFIQNLSLQKFTNCLRAAKYMNNPMLYDQLGRKALEYLELDLALQAFQLAKNLSMVLTIKSFSNENEKKVICGNVAMILGNYDSAQDFYMKSTRQLNALDMRCDIQDYMTALSIAKQIAPDQEPFVCRRLATQIESQGNNGEARKLYEKAVINTDKKELLKSEKQKIDEHNLLCFSGISKTSIRLGDVNRGYNIAKELNDNNVILEIAMVCENLKQQQEAAELYEKIGMYEKAALLFIQKKLFKQVQKLIPLIKSPKILSLYAKSLESEGAYKEAEKVYEKAEDWENVIRLNLSTNIDNFDKAMNTVRTKCPTSTCANMVVTVCAKRGLQKESIEFSILAGKKEDAFTIAQSGNEMDWYVQCMKTFSIEERVRIAQYYEGIGLWVQAADHYEKANNQMKSVKLLIQAGQEHIDQIIEIVVNNNTQESLVQLLLDYLTGELDNVPKDPKYLLKFYLKTGNVGPTISVALTIAQDEMEHGNYKQAHQLLLETIQKFKEKQLQIPQALEQKLSIIHSYILVKRVTKIEDHETAALLLNRICQNISQFASHSVNILTLAVIESTKSNKKYQAYKWSVELVRPETRSQIKEQYKQKIENIARKPVKEEVDESKSQCPFCKELVLDYEFDCKNCQNYIPFCIASGKHIVSSQVTQCPACKFPANINYFKKLLAQDKTCPLCSAEVDPESLSELGEEGIKQMKQQRSKQKEKTQTLPADQLQQITKN